MELTCVDGCCAPEMRAAFRLPLNLIHPRHSFFKYMPELFLCISDWRVPFVLDEIGLFHRIVVVLDSRQEGKKTSWISLWTDCVIRGLVRKGGKVSSSFVSAMFQALIHSY